MKLSLIVVYTTGVTAAFLQEDGFWSSGTFLQARQDDLSHQLRIFPLQRRENYVNLLPQFGVLQRRADRPGRSGSSIGQGSPRSQASSGSEGSPVRQGSPEIPASFTGQASPRSQSPNRPSRPRSPTIRSSVLAQGPATMKIGGNRRTRHIPSGQADLMHDIHPHYSIADAESHRSPPREGQRPSRQVLQAGAKGQSVLGVVRPGRGGKGHIRIETPDGVKETVVRDPEGGYEAGGGNVPGGAKVTVKSSRGGKVTAVGIDQDTLPGT